MAIDLTTTPSALAQPDLSGEASLILIYGAPDLGKRFPLTRESTVGRDEGNEIRIDLSFVSRQHARFRRYDGAWHVTDLGSRNGTHVNGRPAAGEVPLVNGDQVRIGGAIFKYLEGGNVEALFHEEIYRLTIFDALTKIANKRHFLDFLEREIARARRYGSPLALAMLDIDHFKALNDGHGHQAGDQVLEQFAAVLSRPVRREQLLARYGGEEFALVLPELDPPQVLAFCEAERQHVADEAFSWQGKRLSVTVSIGAAILTPEMERAELIREADARLYEAKRTGRNRVVMA
jgi:diguanylate cyclase (GGDEF)-like protein